MIEFTFPGIPSKQAKANGNGCEYNKDNDPGYGVGNITFCRTVDIFKSGIKQEYDGGWPKQHPQNA